MQKYFCSQMLHDHSSRIILPIWDLIHFNHFFRPFKLTFHGKGKDFFFSKIYIFLEFHGTIKHRVVIWPEFSYNIFGFIAASFQWFVRYHFLLDFLQFLKHLHWISTRIWLIWIIVSPIQVKMIISNTKWNFIKNWLKSFHSMQLHKGMNLCYSFHY